MFKKRKFLSLRCFLLVLLLSILVVGCTRGAVVDGENQQPISNATVDLFEWPPPSIGWSDNPAWLWPTAPYSIPVAYSATTTGSHNFWNDKPYNFAFNSYMAADECPETNAFRDEEVADNSWYRVRVMRDGYKPGFFYRYHDGHNELCER